jgi:shikimate kinase
MGTGKTSTGRIVAERLGREFIDMDTVIEAREKRGIPEIFATDGEAYFRKLERALVRELSARDNLVIAPGGGIVLNPDNIRDLQRTGLVICLKASPDQILARVGHETHRPLLHTDDKLQRIRDLLGKRMPLYDAIPHRLETDGQTPAEVAERVLDVFSEEEGEVTGDR